MKFFNLKRLAAGIIFMLLAGKFSAQTFTEQTSVVLPAISSGSTTWGDYNNDGYLDLLISGSSSASQALLSVFKNNGNNTFTDLGTGIFTPAISISVGYGNNLTSAWVDFDNDSYLDIIFDGDNPNGGNSLIIYKNNGNGTFTLRYTFNFINFQGGSAFDCGDYDNDGDIDIVLTTYTKTIVLNNRGNFVFVDVPNIALDGSRYGTVKWIDYDLDRDIDILLSGNGNTYLYQNQGNNTFVKQTGFSPYSSKGSNEWGDYNNDGIPDLLLTGGSTQIYKNNGNNTFTLLSGLGLPYLSDSYAKWGDIDNDGDLDMVLTGNNGSDITKIYLNNSNNTFTEATGIILTGVSLGSLGLGDYDNDGDLDIVISGMNGPAKVCKLYKNNSSVFNPVPAAPGGLSVVTSGDDVILKWNRVATDNTASKALTYNIMAGTVTNGIDLVNPQSLVSGFRKVASIGNSQYDTSIVLRNIKKASYKWKVQSVDNSFKGGPFSTESSFTYSASYQSFSFTAKKVQGKTVNLQWERGNGDNCIVFMKQATSGTAAPANNFTYNASSVFGSGTQIGSTGWFCVYKGTLSSAAVSGLAALTNYIVQVQEFSGTTGSENYNNQVTSQNSITFKTGLFTDINNPGLRLVNGSYFHTLQSSEASWLDFDNDNDLDLFVIGTNGYFLFQNNGSNVFTKMTVTLNNIGSVVKCVDVNNDGYIDITSITTSGTYIYINNGNNTFSQLGVTLPGLGDASIDWGDYNNDGYPDLLITGEDGYFATTTKLFRNNRNSTFTEIGNHNISGVRIGSTAWGDFNNDGFLDVIVSGFDITLNSVVDIYSNDGKGSFKKAASLGSFGLVKAKWGDYDSDGDLDILVVGESMCKIFRNDLNNVFTPLTKFSPGPALYGSGSWGDYDNDGYLDVIVAGYAGISYVPFTKLYHNNHDDTFTEELNCQLLPAGGSKAAWGDYDKDGDIDLLLMGASFDSTFAKIYRNDITIANPAPAAPTGVSFTVTKSDVRLTWNSVRTDNTGYKGLTYNVKVGTSSGAINIVSPHSASTGFRRLAEYGNGFVDSTFYLKRLPFGTYYWSVQAVDNGFAGGAFSAENSFSIVPVQATNLSAKILNQNSLLLKWERGNGDRCVVFSKEGSTGTATPLNNKTYLQDSEFGYGEQIGSTGWYCLYDGRNDSIIVTGLKYKTDYSFQIIEYTGGAGAEQYFPALVNGNPGVFSTGLFSEQTGISLVDAGFNTFAWGDYNNDGLSDFIIPGASSKLYKNNGDNSFSVVSTAVFQNLQYGGAYWGDYDNDGDLDVLLTGCTSSHSLPAYTKLYRNDGGGIFTEQASVSLTGVYWSSAAWGDYNNDGNLDFILAGATGDDPYFNPVTKIYRNNGNSTFTAMDQIVLPGVFRGDVKWVDYDNDGDLDIHLSGSLDYQYNQNCISSIYRNNGNNTFTLAPGINFQGLWEATSAWGDYDNDGDMDVAFTRPGQLFVYRNNGGTFTNVLSKGYGYSSFGCVRWGDFDNDGFLDVLFSNFAGAAIFFKNNNGQSFTEYNDASINFTEVQRIEWCDYDNDGDIDILEYGWGANCKVYRNNLVMKSGQFKPNNVPAVPTGFRAKSTPSGLRLSWKPVLNDETWPLTMSYNIKIGTSISNENIVASHSRTTGFRRMVNLGNAQLDTTFIMKNMASGKYYWKVQAVDQSFSGGPWSPVDSFDVKNTEAFFSSDTVCFGFPTHFADQSVATDGIASRKWDFADGSTSTLQNPVHQFASSGIFNVKLVVTSTGGTRDSLTKAVIVKARPTTGFTTPAICQGSSATITNTTSFNGLTISQWYWNFGDGTFSVDKQPLAHGYLGAGKYSVVLKAVATNGCRDSITKTATVSAYPVVNITTSAPLTFCPGDSVVLSVGYDTAYSYQWKITGTGLTNATNNKYTAKSSGDYTVDVITKAGSCNTTASPVSVTVKPSPEAPVVLSQNYTEGVCPGENPIRLSVESPGAGYSYQWTFNGVPIDKATSTYLEGYLSQGNYAVEATQGSCKATSDRKTLTFVGAPDKPIIYTQGPNLWYLACSNNSAQGYKWYYNGNLIPGANSYIYVAGKNYGRYYVVIVNEKGCYNSSDVVTIPTGTTGVEDVNPFEGLNLYPNPSGGLFSIEWNNQITGTLNISVIAQNGKEIMKLREEKTTVHFSTKVDLTDQPRGIYFISLSIDKYKSNRKIIIK